MTPVPYRRVLLKISGEMLAGNQNYGIHADVLTTLAEEIRDVVRMDVEVALVIGGGNIFSRNGGNRFRDGTSLG